MKNLCFKEFLALREYSYSDEEVYSIYVHNRTMKVREIASMTNRSIAEIYRIVHRYGVPSRGRNHHDQVMSLADSHLTPDQIGQLTGYSGRNVRYILKRNRDGNSQK